MTSDIVKPLTEWYERNRRDLPWRRTADPYRIWVSEIMLQQTRVEAAVGYYERFTDELPNIRALAECGDDRLLKLWEGLGYYSRARNLKRAAEMIVEEMDGTFPDDPETIRTLPGVGNYTAGAVASIAFGKVCPAVDGNVLRVWARYTGYEGNVLSARAKKLAEQEIFRVMVESAEGSGERAFSPGDFNQALIETGALICSPNTEPRCSECPLSADCAALRDSSWDRIPLREKKTARRAEKRTVLLVLDGNRAAVRRRPDTGLLGGLYEFPNVSGSMSFEETVAYLRRGGYDSLHIEKLRSARHIFSHVEWDMSGYLVRIASSEGGRYDWFFAEPEMLGKNIPIASAFSAYAAYLGIIIGKGRLKT